jgi:hypothetical protein
VFKPIKSKRCCKCSKAFKPSDAYVRIMKEYVYTYRPKNDLIWLCQECISLAVEREIMDTEILRLELK